MKSLLAQNGQPSLAEDHAHDAVRWKRFLSIRQMWSCINVSDLCLERVVLWSSRVSARIRSDYRTGLDWAIWATSVRVRRLD
jgi:hypothetical protein